MRGTLTITTSQTNNMKTKVYVTSKTVKSRTLHIATVRAILKKNGYRISRWVANGRIKGLSNRFGDIEVKENYLGSSTIMKKHSDTYFEQIHTEIINVQVVIHNEEIDINKIVSLLKENSLIVSEIDTEYKSLVVDNK